MTNSHSSTAMQAALLSFGLLALSAAQAQEAPPVMSAKPAGAAAMAQQREDALAGFFNRAEIVQIGDDNHALISQTGLHNLALIRQAGNGFSASITQTGNNNIAAISQQR